MDAKTWRRAFIAAASLTLASLASPRAEAQYGYPYGYGIGNGRVAPGYRAAYGLNRGYGSGFSVPRQQTVTNYQPLINAITSIPGWYGPSAPSHPQRPIHPHPTIPRGELLTDDGKILWPSATPNDPNVAASRKAAEAAVSDAVQESIKYEHATVRKVADARNKLTAFARQALPALKARNAADADGLERFIVELQKTLATLAVNY